MSFTSFLTQSATINRFSSTTTDAGGLPVKTWSALATAVPCGFIQASGREIVRGEQVVVASHRLLMEPRDVTERDQIVIGSVTYNILFVDKHLSHHYALDLEELR